MKLFCLGSINRANACASAAIQTLVCVDNELAVLLGNCTNGAFALASAATDAILCNYICHFYFTSKSLGAPRTECVRKHILRLLL